MRTTSRRPGGLVRLFTSAAPYVVAATALGVVLYRVGLQKVLQAAASGNVMPVLVVAAVWVFLQLAMTASWDTQVFRLAPRPPRWRDVIAGKATCAMLNTFGFVFGQGAYGVWLARFARANARQTVTLLGLLALFDAAAGAMVTLAALLRGGAAVPKSLHWTLAAVCVVTMVVLVGLPRVQEGSGILSILLRPPRAVALAQIAGRGLTIFSATVSVAIAMYAFGLRVPTGVAFTYLPVLFLVGSLPLNVAGFGVVQAAWLVFAPWAEAPKIVAFQLLWTSSVAIFTLVRGLPFAREVIRTLRAGPTEAESPP